MNTTKNYNILIIGPGWIGDMVMAQSLFKLIKQIYPSANIDVLSPERAAPVLARMSEVRKAIPLPLFHKKLQLGLRWQIAKSLRKEKYDQAIVIPTSLKAALIPFLAKIPKRTGWLGEFRFGLLTDIREFNEKKYPSMIERFCPLVLPKNTPLPETLPFPSLNFSLENREKLLKKLKLSEPKKSLLILCPGSEGGGPCKQWPPQYYATVADEKIKEGWEIWILGTSKEQETAATIQKLCKNQCVDLTGKTSLLDAIDLISLANMVITLDSGLMHIAAALDRSVIAIYGPTSPNFAPPLSEKGIKLSLNLPCQPCRQKVCPLKHNRCMKDLDPSKVLACF